MWRFDWFWGSKKSTSTYASSGATFHGASVSTNRRVWRALSSEPVLPVPPPTGTEATTNWSGFPMTLRSLMTSSCAKPPM